jgi:heme/copper-type cytochrome/quinol oxidase subunit 3
MSTTTADANWIDHVGKPSPWTGLYNGKLGMWVFLASEVMFFTGLIGSYIVLRFGFPEWPHPADTLDVPLTAFNTFVLICSSVTMALSLAAIERGDVGGLKKWLLATIGLGTFFLGVQIYEYNHLLTHGFTPSSSLFGSAFYTMTGFHGFHVFLGVVNLCVIAGKAFAGKYTKERHGGVEMMGLYWHFVDLVWIVLFTIVYLI